MRERATAEALDALDVPVAPRAHAEVRGEFLKRQKSVGSRNLVRMVCKTAPSEAEIDVARHKAHREDVKRHAQAVGAGAKAGGAAAPSARTGGASGRYDSPIVLDGENEEEEMVMLLDDEGALQEKPPTAALDAQRKRDTWRDLVPSQPAAPTSTWGADATAVESMFGKRRRDDDRPDAEAAGAMDDDESLLQKIEAVANANQVRAEHQGRAPG